MSYSDFVASLKLPDESQLYKAICVSIWKPPVLKPDSKPYVNFDMILTDPQYDSLYHLPNGKPYWTARYYLPNDPNDPNDKYVRYFKSLIFQTYKLNEYPQSYTAAKRLFGQNKWLWLAFTYRSRTDPETGETYYHPYSQLAFPLEEHKLYTTEF